LPIIRYFMLHGFKDLLKKEKGKHIVMEQGGKYNSVAMAKMIVAYANSKHYFVNMTKVQKLLYIVYGVYLSVNGERFTDEHPQAWPYGPVFPTTRNKLLKLNFTSITFLNDDLRQFKSDEDLLQLLEAVFHTFGSWTASQLISWSHGEGTPWERTVTTRGFRWGDRISDEFIEQYFDKIVGK